MNPTTSKPAVNTGRSWYALLLLTLVLTVSMLDRQIVTILSVGIKRDLGLNDSEIGLIYGTVLGIFYAIFSIPLGKLADGWNRVWLIACALALWSLATMSSAFATTFAALALARMIVAVGEAGAGPASYSLLADFFSKERRTTAFAIYGTGTGIGVGLSTAIGGAIVTWWDGRFPTGHGWLGLVGWQAAFIAVGLPGLLLALIVLTVREPQRGISDGIIQPGEAHPFRKAGAELMALLPPLSFINLRNLKAPRREWLMNVVVLVLIVIGVVLLAQAAQAISSPATRRTYGHVLGIELTSHLIQWATVGLGLYATFSWIRAQRMRDPAAYTIMWGSRAFVAMLVIAVFNMTVTYGLTAWGAVYAIQHFHASQAEVGWKLGVVIGGAGLAGLLAGGWIADAVRRRHPLGRMYVLLASVMLPVPMAILTFTRGTLDGFVLCHALLSLSLGSWLPCCTATLHDLVLPRMRGMAIALFYLGITIFGMGTGPYLVGLMSDATGNLGGSILKLYSLSAIVLVAVIVAMRALPREEASLVERARAAGEDL
jgi:MFS transporter, Spinster family, sphingosine-1-phosphate transporter